MTIESRANIDTSHPAAPGHMTEAYTPAFVGIDANARDWRGFAGLLDTWIAAPTFNHTHYLAQAEYRQVFDYLFLMLGRLRKRLIAVVVNDTGAGDEKDEIRLIYDNKKFKIRPI